jgi:hypothetical protein
VASSQLWSPLLDQKDAGALGVRFKEVGKVARHCPEIRGDENPILTRGEAEQFTVGWADRKSIAGSRRRQPVRIALWRLASARKRIIRQLRRETVCCRIRSNLSLTSGVGGWAAV